MNIIDLFAGGGGASEGIRQALGVAPALAVNHDPAAIEMHARNHPGTIHPVVRPVPGGRAHPRRAARGAGWRMKIPRKTEVLVDVVAIRVTVPINDCPGIRWGIDLEES